MILGITGNMGTGKSAFAVMLRERWPCEFFDADVCVHGLLSSCDDVIDAVLETFGRDLRNAEGGVDRAALRAVVFGDRASRQRLESVLHPRVRQEWMSARDACLSLGRNLLADIPLLFETSAQEFFDKTLVVACSPSVQLARLAERGLTPQTLHAMLASQWPIGQKVACADFVVWNDGCRDALARQSGLLAQLLLHSD